MKDNLFKKVFYSLLPLLILFTLTYMDDFKDYKELILLLNGNEGVATITENPFYDISKFDELTAEYDDVDMSKYYDYILRKYPGENKYLRFSYKDFDKVYNDSILFTNYVDSRFEDYLDDFLANTINKDVGSKFQITYYKNLAYPKMVALELKDNKYYLEIIKKMVLIDGIALLLSFLIFRHYFILKQ